MAAAYQLLPYGSVARQSAAVLRTADNVKIAHDPNDPDYQTYVAWLQAGNVPDPETPAASRVMSPLAFMSRFTPAEQNRIAGTALVQSELSLWLLRLAAATEIDLTNVQTLAGIQALVAYGLIPQARADAVLAPGS
jgi:hypothetical protein